MILMDDLLYKLGQTCALWLSKIKANNVSLYFFFFFIYVSPLQTRITRIMDVFYCQEYKSETTQRLHNLR